MQDVEGDVLLIEVSEAGGRATVSVTSADKIGSARVSANCYDYQGSGCGAAR